MLVLCPMPYAGRYVGICWWLLVLVVCSIPWQWFGEGGSSHSQCNVGPGRVLSPLTRILCSIPTTFSTQHPSLPSHREPVWEHHQQKCLFTNLPTEPLLGEARRLWLQGAGDTSATTFEVFLLKECNKVPKVTSTRYFLQNVKLLKTQGVHRGVLSSNARVRNLFHSWLPCQQVELLNKGDFFLTNKLNNWTKITLPTSWPSRQK